MNLTCRVPHTVFLTLELHTIFAPFNVAVYNNTNARNLAYISLSKLIYEGHLESKERFAIQRYLLIIVKKQNM